MARVLFLQDIAFEYMGPMYISAVLKKHGHDCRMIIVSEEKNYLEKIKNYKPDLIAFSTLTGPHKWVLQKAAEIKRHFDIAIVLGGSHPTFFPQIIEEPPVDIVCIGEGEYAALDLVENIEKGRDITRIPNLWVKRDGEIWRNDLRPLVNNLDELPFPDRELYAGYGFLRDLPAQRFLSGRGCPYNCTFCFNKHLKDLYRGGGKYVRKRSIDGLLEEIKQVQRIRKMRLVRFPDDTFTVNKKWMLEFLPKFKKEIGLPFTGLTRADELDEAVVKTLKEAGCLNVFWGVESGNEKMRNEILKKGLKREEIIEAARLLHKYKLRFGTYNMFGLPAETLDMAFETIRLNQQLKVDYPQCTIFQPYPGTEITQVAIGQGLLDPHFENKDLMQEGSVFKNKEINRLVNLHRFSYFAIKYPFLFPLIKQLIKLPPNPVFRLIYELSTIPIYKNSLDLDWLTFIRLGVKLVNKF